MKTAIRCAVLSDIPYLYDICRKTGADGSDATAFFSDPWLLGQYYAAPYLVYNPSLCFVIEKNYEPKGYIVGTDNTNRFNQWFEKIWLPPLRRRYPDEAYLSQKTDTMSSQEFQLISQLHRPLITSMEKQSPWIAEYPAHFHIDILPELQGQGHGRKLIETFIQKLTDAGCSGTHLSVSTKNQGAISFYQKMGFTLLHENKHAKFMGKKC